MSITNSNIGLIKPLAFLSIKKTIIKFVIKIIKLNADYKLFLDKYLLNRKVYLLVILIFKKYY